jgi:hypothetical protein
MNLDPDTTVSGLLRAIPSSAIVFDNFKISVSASDERTVEKICADHGIRLEDFFRALDNLDWNDE